MVMGVDNMFSGKKETKEEKILKEQEMFFKKYGLENLNEKDVEILKKVVADLAGNGLFKAGMAVTFAKAEEQAKVSYLSALVEQNWLIIKKLDEISKKLEG